MRRSAQVFRSGTPTLELFKLGPRPDLLGRSISALRGAGLRQVSVDLDRERALRSVDPEAFVLPASLGGELQNGGPRHILAVVLNGHVAATTRSYGDRGSLRFAALLPPSNFRRGANRVEVYAVPLRHRSARTGS